MKKAIYAVLMILIIVLGIVIVKSITKDDKDALTTIKQSEKNLENDIENVIDTEIEDEIVNETEENEVIEDNVEDDLSGEDKAKAIVSKHWGEDSTVYFENEKNTSLGNGKFEITVRERSTTKILYRYIVNITTGEFTYEVEAY